METIGSRIAAAREHRGLNQSELARLLGVTPQSVQAWESDKNTPRPKRLSEIAVALSISMASLVGDAEIEPQAGESASDAASKVFEMLQKHKGLNAEARQQIVQAVEQTVAEVQRSNVIPADFSRAPKLMDGDILIPQYDLRASMGHGQVPADYVEFMRNVVVSGVQLEKLGLDFTSPANLSIITGWGESMAPTIKSKDPVIVDRGITEFMGDGVYVITWDDMLYIKRLQNAGDGKLDLISDNPKHKARVVNAAEVTVHARVLLVWNAQKL
jgi:transcriptional regulator with XRE-family HTH domain